jgi:hypothetical protein
MAIKVLGYSKESYYKKVLQIKLQKLRVLITFFQKNVSTLFIDPIL